MERIEVNVTTNEQHVIDLTEDEIASLPIPVFPTYQELRAAAYPPIGDQLDAMWKGGEDEAAMHETILAVKAEFPKA